jgi:hypothetical protein
LVILVFTDVDDEDDDEEDTHRRDMSHEGSLAEGVGRRSFGFLFLGFFVGDEEWCWC